MNFAKIKKTYGTEGVKIAQWMFAHKDEYVDDCNEINCTALVEAWDSAESTGDATLKAPDHMAWDIATLV